MNGKKSKLHLVSESELVLIDTMPTGGGSDYTLKQNIADLTTTLQKVKTLRPVVWKWKDDANGQQEYGFIAQEVEKIIPDLVYTDTWKDGTKRKFLSSKGLLPYLIAAVQELDAEIESLKTEIARAKKEVKSR